MKRDVTGTGPVETWTEQILLKIEIEKRPAIRQQLGTIAYEQLIDVVTFLGAAKPVSTIWIDSLFHPALALLHRECPELRFAVARVRQVLESRRFAGVRRVPERQTWWAFDTLEERRGER